LAQLTDILREWSSGGVVKRNTKAPLNRRETLATLATRSKGNPDSAIQRNTQASQIRKRRESSADSGMRSMKHRRDSTFARKDDQYEKDNRDENTSPNSNDFQNVSFDLSILRSKR
jgi:hypothetical protein